MSEASNTRVIFLHRDGRDVAISMRARGYSWAKSVGRWVEDNSAVLTYLDSRNVLSVSFEELTNAASVLRTLRQVADFLELPATDEQLALALMPGTHPHEYQEYCTAYRTDEEKAADLAASLVSVMARQATVSATAIDDDEQQGEDEEGSSKLKKHNEFRTWQMSQAWAEVPTVVDRDWSENEKQEFYANQKAVHLMKRFGYKLEEKDT